MLTFSLPACKNDYTSSAKQWGRLMAKFLKIAQTGEFNELMIQKALAFLEVINSKVFPNAKTHSGVAFA